MLTEVIGYITLADLGETYHQHQLAAVIQQYLWQFSAKVTRARYGKIMVYLYQQQKLNIEEWIDETDGCNLSFKNTITWKHDATLPYEDEQDFMQQHEKYKEVMVFNHI